MALIPVMHLTSDKSILFSINKTAYKSCQTTDSWFNHIEHEDTKLTKLVLHFSDFFIIFYTFYKLCCSVLIGSSDPGSEVPTPIGSFEFLPTIGARPNQNKCVGSSDKVSEVPMIVGGFDFLPSRGARLTQNKHVGSSDKHVFSQKQKSLLWEN